MLKKTIEIVIGAKNSLQQGLDSALASFGGFGKKLKATWAKIWAPAAVAFAVVAAVKKAVDIIDSGFARVITRQNEIKKGNLDAHFNLVSKAIEAQAKAYSDLNKELAARAKHEKDVTGLLAEREAKEARLAALSEMAGKGTEERSEIEKRFEAEQKITDALQEQTKAQMEQSDVKKRMAANAKERVSTEQELKDAEERYAQAAREAQAAGKDRTRGTYAGYFLPKTSAAKSGRLKQAEEAMTREFTLIEKLRDQQKDLAREQSDLAKQREEKDRAYANAILNLEVQKKEQQIKVSGEVAKAREEYQKAVADDEKKRAEESVKAVEDASAKIIELKKKEAEIEKSIAKKTAEAKLAELEKQRQDAQEIAKKTVAQMINDARAAKKEAEAQQKEDERVVKLSEKEQRGVRLSKRDKEFLEAARKRDFAAMKAREFGGKIDAAKTQLDAMNKQTLTLEEIRKDLKKYTDEIKGITKLG